MYFWMNRQKWVLLNWNGSHAWFRGGKKQELRWCKRRDITVKSPLLFSFPNFWFMVRKGIQMDDPVDIGLELLSSIRWGNIQIHDWVNEQMGTGLTNGFTGHRGAEQVPRWWIDRMQLHLEFYQKNPSGTSCSHIPSWVVDSWLMLQYVSNLSLFCEDDWLMKGEEIIQSTCTYTIFPLCINSALNALELCMWIWRIYMLVSAC